MENYIMLNGKKIPLSKETAESIIKSTRKSKAERIVEAVGIKDIKCRSIGIETIEMCEYIVIPLPDCNNEWVGEAYKYALRIIEEYPGCWICYRDSPLFDYANSIYIRVY
jgi:hypothetical protein